MYDTLVTLHRLKDQCVAYNTGEECENNDKFSYISRLIGLYPCFKVEENKNGIDVIYYHLPSDRDKAASPLTFLKDPKFLCV
ncbi:hypothetical protein V6N13_031728 [Hibiscus sabdariffa]